MMFPVGLELVIVVPDKLLVVTICVVQLLH